VTNIGDNGIRIQTARLTTDEVATLVGKLATAYDVPAEKISTSYIGPSWGKDVSRKAITGIVVFLVFVALVMTVYFRNWQMAAAALVALFHDLLITVGVYAAVGFEVTPATVIGFLTILGYSMYDTVVVFDKVRENTIDTLDQSRFTYAEKANLAVNQTLVRSINTSVVALLPVAAILAVGAVVLRTGTLRDISLALFVGMAIGTFSSIFLATPLQVALRELDPTFKAHTAKVLDARSRLAEDAPAVVSAGHLRPGGHRGQAAQPRRKSR
jgi:preprotein translocase subunit SecF